MTSDCQDGTPCDCRDANEAAHEAANTAIAAILEKKGVKEPKTDMIFVYEFPRGVCTTSTRKDYDWGDSTQANYAVEARNEGDCDHGHHGEYKHIRGHVGLYKDIRDERNHTYHRCYTPERQTWQDNQVAELVEFKRGHEKPWLIYTAGGMGVGKGHVLDVLKKKRAVAFNRLLIVNPDDFKAMMPEFQVYADGELDSGSQTHKESSIMQEIAFERGLERGSHMLEDGSLQDELWYAGAGNRDDPVYHPWPAANPNFMGVIKRIKQQKPTYRIAVFHIDMHMNDPEKLQEALAWRLDSRAMKTGRSTSLSHALKSFDKSRATVKSIKDNFLADLVVTFDNSNTQVVVSEIEQQKDNDWHKVEAGWIAEDSSNDPMRALAMFFGAEALAVP